MKKQRSCSARRKRIAELKRQIRAVAGPVAFGGDCPPEIEERFLEHVLAFERQAPEPLFDRLVQAGVPLPPPDDVPDHALADTLWAVIHALALLGAYLECTDHLSDRELYRHLWDEALREPMVLLPHDPTFSLHLDVLGSGSEANVATYLRYYADETTRARWAQDFPQCAVPPHEDPPYDRDRFLPHRDWEAESGSA